MMFDYAITAVAQLREDTVRRAEIHRLMAHNLDLCRRQMLDLAQKAKSEPDAALFTKGAETYKRLREAISNGS